MQFKPKALRQPGRLRRDRGIKRRKRLIRLRPWLQRIDLSNRLPRRINSHLAMFATAHGSRLQLGDVLPLDNSSLARWNTPRPSLTGGRTEFTYSGELTGVPNSGAPSILNKTYSTSAEVMIPKGGGEGMNVNDRGRFGGYGLFLSPAFNWWSNADLLRNIGLGFLALGLLLVWRGPSKNWSHRRT